MIYALIKDGSVDNIIKADADFVASLPGYSAVVDVTNINPLPAIGWVHNGGTSFTKASPPTPIATYGSKITTDAFYRRLTPAERIRIEMASIDNPAASAPQRQLAASLRVAQRRLAGAAYFDLKLEANITDVNSMELAGLLDYAGRANVIMTAPVTDPTELPGAIRLAYGLPEFPT